MANKSIRAMGDKILAKREHDKEKEKEDELVVKMAELRQL